MNVLPDAEDQYRRELYTKGLTDKEIAEIVFVNKNVIRAWRAKRGLPSHIPWTGRKRLDHEEIIQLKKAGYSTAYIADQMACTTAAVNQIWRAYRREHEQIRHK